MDFAFVPDQMFCFSLVTVRIVVPYYSTVSGWDARVAAKSAKSRAESMGQLAASERREHFFTFFIHAVFVSSDPGCHE